MRTFLLVVIVGLVSPIFFSCQKEPSVTKGDRLKMIRWKEGDSLSYKSFEYDDQNRLTGNSL
jgi:hypothetical protein